MMENPDELLRRLKLGREEYCQRLMTMLILEDDYPRWNTPLRPSKRGLRFLRALDALSFGVAEVGEDDLFVDEFDLPRRTDAEAGGAPDYGVLGADRLWMIELKTEVASHRRGQLDLYFTLAAHHHPDQQLDLTYLTPEMPSVVEAPDQNRIAHVHWAQVLPLVESTWGGGGPGVQALVDGLRRALDSMGSSWPTWREGALAELADPVARAKALARLTEQDGRQRALDFEAGSLEELQVLRLQARDALLEDGVDSVQPWLWNSRTSGGQPLTRAGEGTGFELRLSRGRPRLRGTPAS